MRRETHVRRIHREQGMTDRRITLTTRKGAIVRAHAEIDREIAVRLARTSAPDELDLNSARFRVAERCSEVVFAADVQHDD